MKRSSSTSGFILPVTVFLLFVCSVAIAAVLGYVAFTTRMTAVHLGNSVCRLAAQSAIEAAKSEIYNTFYQYSGDSAVRIGTMTGTAFGWVVIPEGCVKLGNSCFADCSGLLLVSIPDSVAVIGDNAFGSGVILLTADDSDAAAWADANGIVHFSP